MSSPILSVEKLSKSYPGKLLFDEVTFAIGSGEKVGVMGLNGAGKSTLIKIVAGVEPADQGAVIPAGGTTIGFLSQNPDFEPGLKILDAVFSANDDKMRLLADYERACAALAQGVEGASERVSKLANRLEIEGVYALETRARSILTALGVTDFDTPIERLSGGQKKLVALAGMLVGQPDVLLMDEPTNHLDIGRIQWLEKYLKQSGSAVLLVTHDRLFLDRVCTRILEVEREQVADYAGNYAFYLERKQQLEVERAKAASRHQTHLRQELAWLAQGPRARSTRQKARLNRARELVDKPIEGSRKELSLDLGMRRLGKKILEAEGLSGRVVQNFDFELAPGDRVGIIGPNGCGKTTLLELLTGRLEPEAGRLEVGSTVHLGYFDQHTSTLDPNQRVIESVRDIAEHLPLGNGKVISAARLLERFLFAGHSHHNPVEKLSGGEKRRLELLRILMDRPNLLVLDEPTNDLDVHTLIRLEEYLDDFAGCLLVVSHDRYFLDRVATRFLVFEEVSSGRYRAREHLGLVEELDFSIRSEREVAAPSKSADPAPPAEKPKKLSYKEQRELEELERFIAEAEQRQQDLKEEMASNPGSASVLAKAYEELGALDAKLEASLERWAELEERNA